MATVSGVSFQTGLPAAPGDADSTSKRLAFLAGSILTQPWCDAKQCIDMILTVDWLNPTSFEVANLARKFFLVLEAVWWAGVGLLTTLPGIILRAIAAGCEETPFVFYQGKASPKVLPSNQTFSLLSWNVCGVGAGYTITDGGVLPREYRLDSIVSEMEKVNADVVCLYEVFDVVTGQYFVDKLKKKKNGYNHFYWNIGAAPGGIGCTSALLVASKYEVDNPQFIPFSKDTLVGRTKWAEKGLFAFDLKSGGNKFITCICTHPQQSEMPSHHTQEEETGRAAQFQVIADIAKQVVGPLVIAGDFNAEKDEIEKNPYFKTNMTEGHVNKVGPTWGGDELCATWEGKQVSKAQDIDHVYEQGVKGLVTTIPFDTHFNAKVFKEEAISDHWALHSLVTLY